MTTVQLKNEIQNVLDKVPENVLQDILYYLKDFQTKTKDQIDKSRHLRMILTEDRELLEKLAQ